MKYSLFSVSDFYPDIQTDPNRFLMEQVELVQAAEDAGYYAYFNAEHHFHEYGLVPDPAVLFGAVAMKSSRIKFGPAVSILPFHNPLRVAEQWALVDQLSQGRLILGVGSGYLMHEFEGFSMSPATKRARFDETLAIMEHALTGERFSYAGEFYNFKNVKLNITPYQGRKLETPVAVLAETAAYYIGKRGYPIMTIPYATVDRIGELKSIYDNYRKGWAESGRPGRGEIIAAVHTHVGDKPATDDELARKHLEIYVYSRLYARHASYDECLNRGVVAMGTPDEAAGMMQNFIDAGADHLMFIFNFGAMPMSEVLHTLERTHDEVLPLLKPRSEG
ncbi:MAG: LLM class flavin-dependent oxidoreductase [Calditrichaeota bacterium]|nr:LLM class flavin-dependent oxidoreductase [Calditrichota bacterium]